MKIIFYDSKKYVKDSFSKYINDYNYEFKFVKYRLDEDSAPLAKGYDVVCAFVNDVVSKEVIDILYDLNIKLIAMRCAGYNNVDFEYAYGKIHIVRVPAYSPYAVAEHAMALIMSLDRKIYKAYNRTRDNNFNISGLEGFDLNGKTVGIIGMGKIGEVFAKICNGFGMKILAYDLYPKDIDYIEYVSLDKLYRESDIVSLHCPLNNETHHMINKDSIALMKDNVMLINISRGGLINTEDLIESIKERKIGSAGLDAYEEEANYFFEDFSSEIIEDDDLARLLTFNNVIITSHQAFLTYEALDNIASTTLDNIKAFENGETLKNEVCYKWDKKDKCKCF